MDWVVIVVLGFCPALILGGVIYRRLRRGY